MRHENQNNRYLIPYPIRFHHSGIYPRKCRERRENCEFSLIELFFRDFNCWRVSWNSGGTISRSLERVDMQQVLRRGGKARLKVRKEGGGNKSRRARAGKGGEATNLTRKRSFNETRGYIFKACRDISRNARDKLRQNEPTNCIGSK